MDLYKITCATELACQQCVEYIKTEGWDAVQVGSSRALITDFNCTDSRQVNQMQRFSPITHEANEWDEGYFNEQIN